MNLYGKFIDYGDGEIHLIVMEMTAEDRNEHFPDWERVETLEKLYLRGEN